MHDRAIVVYKTMYEPIPRYHYCSNMINVGPRGWKKTVPTHAENDAIVVRKEIDVADGHRERSVVYIIV